MASRTAMPGCCAGGPLTALVRYAADGRDTKEEQKRKSILLPTATVWGTL
eukprot:gene5190-25691_t